MILAMMGSKWGKVFSCSKKAPITNPASPGIAAVIEDGSAWEKNNMYIRLFEMNPRLKHHESNLERQTIELDQVPSQDSLTFQFICKNGFSFEERLNWLSPTMRFGFTSSPSEECAQKELQPGSRWTAATTSITVKGRLAWRSKFPRVSEKTRNQV